LGGGDSRKDQSKKKGARENLWETLCRRASVSKESSNLQQSMQVLKQKGEVRKGKIGGETSSISKIRAASTKQVGRHRHIREGGLEGG